MTCLETHRGKGWSRKNSIYTNSRTESNDLRILGTRGLISRLFLRFRGFSLSFSFFLSPLIKLMFTLFSCCKAKSYCKKVMVVHYITKSYYAAVFFVSCGTWNAALRFCIFFITLIRGRQTARDPYCRIADRTLLYYLDLD